MHAASQENATSIPPQLCEDSGGSNISLCANLEPKVRSFPPLIDAPACRLTEEEWRRINHGMLLTARELDVVKGMMRGETEVGIAVQLGISTNTVHTHLGRIYKKLGVHGSSGLILRVFSAHVQIIRQHAPLRHENMSPH